MDLAAESSLLVDDLPSAPPPLLVSDDVLTVAPQIDGMLLVATQGMTARTTLEQAKEVLADMNLLGVVLNRSTERDDSPYY